MSTVRNLAWLLVSAAACGALGPDHVRGQDRVFEQDGMLYREVRTIDRIPLSRIEWEEQPQTVPAEVFSTVFHEVPEQVAVPVIDYRFQPTGGPLVEHADGTVIPGQWIPFTRWETRTEVRRVPQTVRQVVPATRVVRVPVRHLGFVAQERVDRLALGPAPPRTPAGGESTPYVARVPAPPTGAATPTVSVPSLMTSPSSPAAPGTAGTAPSLLPAPPGAPR